ncbi:MAG: ABC transporter ATP-binding protein, partial [Shewanella sp.]
MDQEFPPILEFSKVNKVFRGKNGVEKPALKDLSLRLSAGMVVGLLGQNGAGKSTLMRCALGILSPDSGDIRTLGETPEQLSSAAKERLGYVPQQPFGYEGFTVERALDLHRSFYPHWDMQLEQDWLTRFELDVSQQIQRLSVGQRQSLALIMAMAYRPELLILDEPVASLDPIVRRKFMVDLFDLALESGSAVLFSSHITSDLERVASHVALIKQGELVLFKEIDALREEVCLLKLAAGTELPEQVRILSRDGDSVLVDRGDIELNLPGVLR